MRMRLRRTWAIRLFTKEDFEGIRSHVAWPKQDCEGFGLLPVETYYFVWQLKFSLLAWSLF